MNENIELYRQTAYDAEIDRYIRDSQSGACWDWTRFDEDANAKLVAKLNNILRPPSKQTNNFVRRFERANSAILALEAIDKHIEYCATEHARICRENGRL